MRSQGELEAFKNKLIVEERSLNEIRTELNVRQKAFENMRFERMKE